MSVDKYPSIFLRQMEAIVYLPHLCSSHMHTKAPYLDYLERLLMHLSMLCPRGGGGGTTGYGGDFDQK